ncbi:unnamed protein product, partial [Closterium sp. NIES-54]
MWHIYLPHGGWCRNANECVGRSRTALGSSTFYPADPTIATIPPPSFNGILSSNSSINPPFYNWNLVRLIYCDGGGYAGTAGRVDINNNTAIYLDGWNILQAVIEDLKSNQGIKSADQILLSGSSAGGQAVVTLCDRIAAAFPWAPTKCISDSGFFIDSKDRVGGNTWRASAQSLVAFHKPNWTGCMDALPNSDHWNCLAATTLVAAASVTAAADGGAAGSAAGARGAGGATGSAGGAAGAGEARGGQRRPLPLLDDPTPEQLREWVLQRARPCGGGFGFLRTAQRLQQSQQETFSPQVLSKLFPQRCVTGSVKAAALGASEFAAALGASESAAALGASESAVALGASASPAISPSSAEALHTFTLDSGASRCFFRDCTILTPLAASVPVSPADPTGGPVVARASTFLPCQVAASSQVSASDQLAASCSCRVLSYPTLLWHYRLDHPSLPRLHGMHSCLLVSGLPMSLPSLPRPPAPPCLPCVEGRQRAAPHSSEFPPITAPLQTLHMD